MNVETLAALAGIGTNIIISSLALWRACQTRHLLVDLNRNVDISPQPTENAPIPTGGRKSPHDLHP